MIYTRIHITIGGIPDMFIFMTNGKVKMWNKTENILTNEYAVMRPSIKTSSVVSDLVGHPEDRFSCDAAHINFTTSC